MLVYFGGWSIAQFKIVLFIMVNLPDVKVVKYCKLSASNKSKEMEMFVIEIPLLSSRNVKYQSSFIYF